MKLKRILYEMTISGLEKQLINKYNVKLSLDYDEIGNYLEINGLIVPKQSRRTGIGTSVMNDIIKYADEYGMKIALTPSADYGGDLDQLYRFYKKFGFVETDGDYDRNDTAHTFIYYGN